MRPEAYKLFGVDVTLIPGLNELAIPIFSRLDQTSQCDFLLLAILLPGWDYVLTMTRAAAKCCGLESEGLTTVPHRCPGWQPVPSITIAALLETSCGA